MGFLSKLFKGNEKVKVEEKPKIIKNGEWEVHLKEDGTPHWFFKSGREWFEADVTVASPSRCYFIHSGFDGAGNGAIALTTQSVGIKLKKADAFDFAVVTDDGLGYALENDGTFNTITSEKAGQRTLRMNDEDPEKVILTSLVAAAVYDNWEDTVTVKGIELSTGKAWKKSVKYKEPETYGDREVELEKTDTGIKVTLQDGTTHAFTADGVPE